MGGRGASSSLPTATPGGGAGDNNTPKDYNPGSPSTLEEALGVKGRPMSAYDAVMNANPFYDSSYGEYSENCQRAVVATEARFRGYDVIAQPTYDNDDMPMGDEWKKSFKNAKTDYVGKSTAVATQKALESKMKSYGNGARGIVAVEWKGHGNSGHVLNVVQRNGKTLYYDGQIGATYNGRDLFNAVKPKSVELVRTDNLDFGDRAKEAIRTNPFKNK